MVRLRPSRGLEGFTLLELMVVVIIIMVAVAIAVPTLSSAFAERRTAEAALETVRVARRGRSEANGSGVAYLLRFNDAFEAPLGGIRLFRGNTSGCNSTDWTAINAIDAECAGNEYCVDQVFMPTYQRGASEVRVTVTGMAGIVDLCFEPSGGMRWRNGAGAAFNATIAGLNGGVQYEFTRLAGGAPQGVVRQVIFPFGGDARIRR